MISRSRSAPTVAALAWQVSFLNIQGRVNKGDVGQAGRGFNCSTLANQGGVNPRAVAVDKTAAGGCRVARNRHTGIPPGPCASTLPWSYSVMNRVGQARPGKARSAPPIALGPN